MTWLGIGNRLYLDVKFILQRIATFSQFCTPKIVAAVSRQQIDCACVHSLYKCIWITFVCLFETINKDVSLHGACFAKYFLIEDVEIQAELKAFCLQNQESLSVKSAKVFIDEFILKARLTSGQYIKSTVQNLPMLLCIVRSSLNCLIMKPPTHNLTSLC